VEGQGMGGFGIRTACKLNKSTLVLPFESEASGAIDVPLAKPNRVIVGVALLVLTKRGQFH